MSNSTLLQTQQQSNRALLESSTLSKIADIPSEATRFLSDPKEYVRTHDLQLSDQLLKDIETSVYYSIPDECIALQSRNPFLKTSEYTSNQEIRDEYQPNMYPVVTLSAASAGAAAVAAAAGLASIFAKR
jgi:hypothetical protein